MYYENEAASENPIRGLVSRVATNQLTALGYSEQLEKIRTWFDNPLEGFVFSEGVSDKFIEEMKRGIPEASLSQMVRISERDQARKLVAAALYGIPFSQDENGVVLVSYDFEEPSNSTIQTEFDPNKDSKHMARPKPNIAGTTILKAKVTEGFEQNKMDNPSLNINVTPVGTAFHVEIVKAA